jgi:hypothetical protein
MTCRLLAELEGAATMQETGCAKLNACYLAGCRRPALALAVTVRASACGSGVNEKRTGL